MFIAQSCQRLARLLIFWKLNCRGYYLLYGGYEREMAIFHIFRRDIYMVNFLLLLSSLALKTSTKLGN